jgi:hypothetical protein
MGSSIFFTAAMIHAYSHSDITWQWWDGRTYIPPLPRDLTDLKARIIAAVENIDAPMLKHVWQELEYLIDVWCVTRGEHIEHV